MLSELKKKKKHYKLRAYHLISNRLFDTMKLKVSLQFRYKFNEVSQLMITLNASSTKLVQSLKSLDKSLLVEKLDRQA